MSLLEIARAWELVAAACRDPLPAESVALDEALGRVAAEDALSAVDLPPFDRSAMDGFALVAADTDPPRSLVVAGQLAAGDVSDSALSSGSAIGITTGAALPEGADAVLRIEDAKVDGGYVTPVEPVAVGTAVRYRGEDVARGDVLAPAGCSLGVQHVTALASAGVGAVAVHRQPVVHVLATGTELLELGAPPEPGRIHESNRLTLRMLAERAGAEVVVHPVVPDEPAATAEAVEAGLNGDVLAVSGGVSVGPHDHVKPALQERGVEEVFWRVRLKPGKPLWFGRRGATLVFGLPGNPLSTVACFLLFVGPALRRLQGDAAAAPPYVPARLAVPARPADGRTTLLTARIVDGADGVLEATPTEGQGSHLTGALAASDGFVVIPHAAGELPAGSAVDALLL
ncbi:MAG TPA: gephyrin-like molybdotransferase Glp [Solirubrobacteraceae bacterium]|nr:gephyrin-like molybdotransferase Glp [Solirubrobacteraceae bacterium]